jgi:hypothetical protein
MSVAKCFLPVSSALLAAIQEVSATDVAEPKQRCRKTHKRCLPTIGTALVVPLIWSL